MSVTLFTTQPGANADYVKYLYTASKYPTKNHQVNSSILLDFSMIPYDSSFVQLKRGAYINFSSSTYPNWFTGYITSQPERVYLGTKSGVPTWYFNYQATSDDYILNLSTLGVLPPFIGVTMGYVVKFLVNLISPGVFDVTDVHDGLLLANYKISPDKRFSDVIKDFTGAANYLFWANNGALHFKQQDYTSSTLVIDGNDKHFTPSNLTLTPELSQIVNDCAVVGDISPQAYLTEYITGDGFTGSFPLFTGVYGADKYILLNEQFQGSSISSQNWTINDNGNNWLQLYNGYLNVLGGSNNNSYDISLQSLFPILLEGTTRITHGEFDFVPQTLSSVTTGVIAGLWTQAPNSGFAGCLFGIETFYNSGGVFGVRPVIAGTPQTSMFQLPDTSGAKRYVFRTIMTCNGQHRFSQSQSYRDSTGTVNTISTTDDTDTAYFLTTASEIDVTTGLITNSWIWENNAVALASNVLYATYVPVASNNLHLTVTGITISLPLHASLDKAKIVLLDNNNFDTWLTSTIPVGWGYFNNVEQETSDVISGDACKIKNTNIFKPITAVTSSNPATFTITGHNLISGNTYSISGFTGTGWTGFNGNNVITVVDPNTFSIATDSTSFNHLSFGSPILIDPGVAVGGITREIGNSLLPNKSYQISARVKKGYVADPLDLTGSNITIDIADIVGTVYCSTVLQQSGFQEGLTGYSQFYDANFISTTDLSSTLLSSTPLYLRVYLGDKRTTGSGAYAGPTAFMLIDDIVIFQDWEALVIGPNDIDSLLGDDTVATIESTNNLPQTITATGVPTYNPGASRLVFFKNTVLQTSTQPQPNEIYRITYRAMGNCFGRVQNKVSIADEAVNWGDSGVRAQIVTNIKPRPRNELECEIVAGATVGEDGYQHYNGSYTQLSNYLSQEPLAGTILKFQNLSAYMPPVTAEEINSVSSQFISIKPVERFQHTVQFGKPDYIKKTLASLSEPQGSFQEYSIGQESDNQIVDISNIGLSTIEDVTEPILVNWDSVSFSIDPNQTSPSGGGFEFRSSDSNWGCEDGNNLLGRSSVSWGHYPHSSYFTLSRQNKTSAVFIKAFDTRNKMPYSEFFVPVTNALASNYAAVGGATITPTKLPGPNSKTSTIASVVMPASSAFGGFTGTNFCSIGQHVSVSLSIQPHANAVGKQMAIQLYVGTSTIVTTQTITLANGWNRYTVTGVAGTADFVKLVLYNSTGSSYTVNTSQFSSEFGTQIETVYCKTLATAYGALSRFASVVRIAFSPINGPVGAYVDATLITDTINTTIFVSPPSKPVIVGSGSVIIPDALIKSIESLDDVTLDTIPVINGGINGQYLTVVNVGTFTITLPSASVLTGSTISTPGSIVLGANDLYSFLYQSGVGWVKSVSANPSVPGATPITTLTAAADGSFTPDFNSGISFRIILTQDAFVNLPINILPSVATNWAIEIDQSGSGGFAVILNDGYHCNYTLSSHNSPAGTRCVVSLITDQSGNTYPSSAPSVDQPTP